MSTMFPEPVAVAEPPLALAVRRKPNRKSWTQAEVVALVRSYEKCQPNDILMFEFPERFGLDESLAKLVTLGLIPKPVKAGLSDDDKCAIEMLMHAALPDEEPQRTLYVRYAISCLQRVLPKRAEK